MVGKKCKDLAKTMMKDYNFDNGSRNLEYGKQKCQALLQRYLKNLDIWTCRNIVFYNYFKGVMPKNSKDKNDVAKIFKENGYSAMWDFEDISGGSWNSQSAMIMLDRKDLKTTRPHKLSEKELQEARMGIMNFNDEDKKKLGMTE